MRKTKEALMEQLEYLKTKKKVNDLKFEIGRADLYDYFLELWNLKEGLVLESFFNNVYPNSSIISQCDYLADGKVLLKINIVPDINEPNKLTSVVDIFEYKELKERAKQLLEEALKLSLRLNPYE